MIQAFKPCGDVLMTLSPDGKTLTLNWEAIEETAKQPVVPGEIFPFVCRGLIAAREDGAIRAGGEKP